VRQGHGPHRAIRTGVGPVEVRRAKVRDRGDVDAKEKIRFTSAILPKWARRTKSLDALLPILYLRGVSTGDFQEALAALLGLPKWARRTKSLDALLTKTFTTPDSCAAANQHHYSITSSARASSVGGTSMPSALAVLRLMTISNLVGS
jgi:hypothetical protein